MTLGWLDNLRHTHPDLAEQLHQLTVRFVAETAGCEPSHVERVLTGTVQDSQVRMMYLERLTRLREFAEKRFLI